MVDRMTVWLPLLSPGHWSIRGKTTNQQMLIWGPLDQIYKHICRYCKLKVYISINVKALGEIRRKWISDLHTVVVQY